MKQRVNKIQEKNRQIVKKKKVYKNLPNNSKLIKEGFGEIIIKIKKLKWS